MVVLRSIPHTEISQYFVDFQKKSKNFDMPLDTSEDIGIYKDGVLIGYFIIQGYNNIDVEITHGYLLPKYRHNDLPKECMKILEESCKKAGYKKMMLATGSRFRSYMKFAKDLGYKPAHIEFIKEL